MLARAKGEWVSTAWLQDNMPTYKIREGQVQTCHIRQMAFRARAEVGREAVASISGRHGKGYRMASELLIQRILEIAREG